MEPTPTPTPSKVSSVTPTKDPVTGWIIIKENLTYVEFAMTIPWIPDERDFKQEVRCSGKNVGRRYGEEIAKKCLLM